LNQRLNQLQRQLDKQQVICSVRLCYPSITRRCLTSNSLFCSDKSFSAFGLWTLDGHEWSPSSPNHFIPREIFPGTHSIGSWLGPEGGLDVVEKRKCLSSVRDSLSI
jgi:hypothetical protein